MAVAAGEGTGMPVVTVAGLDKSLGILTKAGAQLHGLDSGKVYAANSAMRAAAKQLAERLARTTISPLLQRASAPQGPAMARTVRPRVDRMPVVRIGATNPRLSGWRRNPLNSRYRGSIAFGVERGWFPGSRNYYQQNRRASGYVIGPNMGLIAQRVKPDYEAIVLAALTSAGVTSFGRAA